MKIYNIILIVLILSLSLLNCCTSQNSEKRNFNVLFIIVDDLRPELNCYGEEQIISPNIDQLAADGLKFTNTICQVPVCGASRASFLTGLRPTRNRFINYNTEADVDAPGIESLPALFKSNGYQTISNGKVFHHRTDNVDAWSEEPWWPNIIGRDYLKKENIQIASNNKKQNGPSYEIVDTTDDAYHDGKVVEKSIKDLQKLSESDKPFFLAVGIRKPHLPFTAPKKYWDFYNPDSIELASNPYKPKNAPDAAMHNFGELRNYSDIPKSGKISDEKARILTRGYYASVTYADKLIGDLIGELKKLDLYDNTIILIMGDHGYQLGEHGLWCKHCNFETSLRAPLIIRVPGMLNGVTIEKLSEYVDIFPTLSELCNLPKPKHLEGISLVELLEQPSKPIKSTAYSRFKNGETAQTEMYAYTEFINREGDIYAKMLYDHEVDPDENINVVNMSEKQSIVKNLSEKLKFMRDKN